MSARYFKPASLDEALSLLEQYGDEAKVLGGGTAVVLLLQQRLIAPQALIDISAIPGLAEVQRGDDGLHLGPACRLRQLERSPELRQAYPGLAACIASVGNVRIRNQATLGGNLAEADYASDPPTFLMALDASVDLTSAGGSRRLKLSDFLLGLYTTALEPAELITDIVVPPLPAAYRNAYIKFKTRSSEDRPCLGIAALAAFESGRCLDLRLAVGAACEIPRRLPDVEALAKGQPLTDSLVAEIAHAYAEQIETLEDLRGSSWYRAQMIDVHVRRGLQELSDGHG